MTKLSLHTKLSLTSESKSMLGKWGIAKKIVFLNLHFNIWAGRLLSFLSVLTFLVLYPLFPDFLYLQAHSQTCTVGMWREGPWCCWLSTQAEWHTLHFELPSPGRYVLNIVPCRVYKRLKPSRLADKAASFILYISIFF